MKIFVGTTSEVEKAIQSAQKIGWKVILFDFEKQNDLMKTIETLIINKDKVKFPKLRWIPKSKLCLILKNTNKVIEQLILNSDNDIIPNETIVITYKDKLSVPLIARSYSLKHFNYYNK